MNFFVYSRAAPGADPGPALTEEHWSYMDRFAAGMVARGPTLGPDRETWAGSIHIVDLPGADAAHAFVEHEPYNRAGLFAEHLVRRFDNLLGRTMWEFPGASDARRFMVIAESASLPDLARERLIVHGELDDATTVLALQAPGRDAVEALVGAGARILDWELGGRR
jgi:uncharacterized protein YciI